MIARYVGSDFVGKTVERVVAQGRSNIAAIIFTDGTFTFFWGRQSQDPKIPSVFVPPSVGSSWALGRLADLGIASLEDAQAAREEEEAAERRAREEWEREQYAILKKRYEAVCPEHGIPLWGCEMGCFPEDCSPEEVLAAVQSKERDR